MLTFEDLRNEDPAAWDELIHAVASDDGPAPDAKWGALIVHGPAKKWEELAYAAIDRSEVYFTSITPMRAFRRWFTESVLLALGPDDPRGWELRYNRINLDPGEDGGVAAATEFLVDIKAAGGRHEDFCGEVLLLIVKGAFINRQFAVAQKMARQAVELFRENDNAPRLNFALRRLGVAELYVHNWELGLQCLEAALQQRGPLFGGGGSMVIQYSDEPLEFAIDEIRDIAAWASVTTPEWVRAFGALALVIPDPALAESWQKKFREMVADLAESSSNPESDIEVITRHAVQRDQYQVAAIALEVWIDVHPDDDWAAEQLAGVRSRFE